MPFIIKTRITDHFPTFLHIPVCDKIDSLEGKYLKILDDKKFKAELKTTDWTHLYNTDSSLEATEIFTSTLLGLIDKNTKTVKQRRAEIKRKCWITQGLAKSIITRDKMYRRCKQNPDNVTFKQQFITYRTYLNNLIKYTKISYYRTEIERNKHCTKSLWETVKNISCTGKKRSDIKAIIGDNNEAITDNLKMANHFNDFYAEVGERYASKIPKPNTPPPTRSSCPRSMFLYPTSEVEVEDIIKSLPPKKAPGLDSIKSETLKIVCDEIKQPLTYVINKIIECGVCPPEFKTAIIIPIFKSGSKTEVSNYRPISLVSVFTKIFEKVIQKRLNAYIRKYNLLSNLQFGFREGRSTEDAISMITGAVYESLEQSESALCVFLDLAKAFDTVSHMQLLGALEDMGVRGTALRLFASYLSGRGQHVRMGSSISSKRIVRYGVPQGTILGPILFSIYLNSLFSLNCRGKIISFADDTAIIYKADSWNGVKEVAEDDLSDVINWFDHKLLTINLNKTVFLPFACNRNGLPQYTALTVNNSVGASIQIRIAHQAKYLGITVDRCLKWDAHVTNITKTLRSILYKFKCLRDILNLPQMKTVYFALVESRLRYGILGWGGVAKSHLKKLESMQKRFLKIMCRRELTYPTEQLYREAGVLDIRQLYFTAVVVHHYKSRCYNTYVEHDYPTRYKSRGYFRTKFSDKTIGQRCHTYLASRLYNSLPGYIRTGINSVALFKKKVKQFLINSTRDVVHNLINPPNV